LETNTWQNKKTTNKNKIETINWPINKCKNTKTKIEKLTIKSTDSLLKNQVRFDDVGVIVIYVYDAFGAPGIYSQCQVSDGTVRTNPNPCALFFIQVYIPVA